MRLRLEKRLTVGLGLAACAAAAFVGLVQTAESAPPDVPQTLPAFAVPAGGHEEVQRRPDGLERHTLYNADGTVFASQDRDPQNRPVRTEFRFSSGGGTAVFANYGDGTPNSNRQSPEDPGTVERGSPDARNRDEDAPPRKSSAFTTSAKSLRGLSAATRRSSSCLTDSRNPDPPAWAGQLDWYWVSSSTPSYLDPTNTLASLRDAHTEWVNNVNWCGISDSSNLGTSYQGTISSTFGPNFFNTVGWGDVSALGLAGCPSGTIACTQYWYDGSNAIYEADTRFDNTSGMIWYNGSLSTRYDVGSVMAHEMGHQVGFSHVNDPSNVMYPIAQRGDVSDRQLGRGDANENNVKY